MLRRRAASSCNAFAIATFFCLFLFYQYTVLSTRAEDAQHMYSRGSVVDEGTIIDPEICSPSPIFTGLKSATFGIIFHITRLGTTGV